MTNVASVSEQAAPHYNLLGQRLGRKGRDTRERILAATERLLADPARPAITLSEVARRSSLAMTTLYLYFGDLTELLIAVLEPVMASAEEAFVARLRRRWPDETLAADCHAFVSAYIHFWQRNGRILHLRNHYADMGDQRLIERRIEAAYPLIDLLARQMRADPDTPSAAPGGMPSVMFTALERSATVATHGGISDLMGVARAPRTQMLLDGAARLLELCIRDGRSTPPGDAPHD